MRLFIALRSKGQEAAQGQDLGPEQEGPLLRPWTLEIFAYHKDTKGHFFKYTRAPETLTCYLGLAQPDQSTYVSSVVTNAIQAPGEYPLISSCVLKKREH